MILAIDTTHAIGSIALVEQGVVLKEITLDGGDGYSHLLFEAIAELGAAMDTIDGFAAACGPGTFTGVRIGLTAVKGLGEAMHKPAYGLSNLEALLTFAKTPHAIPFYDARRGDVYARLEDGSEVVMPLAQVLQLATSGAEWISFEPIEGLVLTTAPRIIAGAIGILAENRWREGDRPDPASLDANYVRRTDAELNWREA